MSILKFTTMGFGTLVGLALATGGVAAAELPPITSSTAAAEPWVVLDGIEAAPMSADEMDAVQGKFTAFDVAALGTFRDFGGGVTGFLYNPDNDPVLIGFTVE